MASVSKREWTYKGATKSAWVVRYLDQGGKHRQRTFERKKEADAYRLTVENEKNMSLHVAASQSVTIASLAKEFEEDAYARADAGRRMGSSHLRSTLASLRKYIVPKLGTVLVADLTWNQVNAWAAAIAADPAVGHSTLKRNLHMLKRLLDFGMRRGYVHRNRASEVMPEYRGGQKSRIRTFTAEQVKTVLRVSGERPAGHTHRAILLMQCYAHIAALAGLRFGEISGLTVENVDFEGGYILVRHNLTDEDLLKGPKTKAGVRDVPMAGIIASLLREWIGRYYIGNDRGLIFRAPTGKMVSPQTFHRNHWHRCLTRAGLGPDAAGDWYHFHALRHFCASAMIDANVPLTDVAAMLGHSAFDVTLQVYAHSISSSRRRIEALDSIAGSIAPTLLIAQGAHMAPKTAEIRA